MTCGESRPKSAHAKSPKPSAASASLRERRHSVKAFCRRPRKQLAEEAADRAILQFRLTRKVVPMSMEEATLTPAKLSPRDRAEATDRAAKAIIDSEAIAREKKTEKLRAMRMAKATSQPVKTKR